MRFAATLTATGLLGFLLLEALKILLAPVGLWLLGVAMLGLKIVLIAVGVSVALGVGIFVYRRVQRTGEPA